MFRYFVASLLLAAVALTDASAQTKPVKARKKTTHYSVRSARKKPAVAINPHTGKPFGYGVSQDLKDGSGYLAPGVPMRKQEGYRANGGYNDLRPHRPGTKKPGNSSLSRDANASAGKAARK